MLDARIAHSTAAYTRTRRPEGAAEARGGVRLDGAGSNGCGSYNRMLAAARISGHSTSLNSPLVNIATAAVIGAASNSRHSAMRARSPDAFDVFHRGHQRRQGIKSNAVRTT